MSQDTVFFAEQGLTSTSANHVANLAKEFVKNCEYELKNISFYNTQLSIIGSAEREDIHVGWTSEKLATLSEKLDAISQANALIAWLREAIKTQERIIANINAYDLAAYYAERNVKEPEMPEKKRGITKEEYIETLSIKERNRILTLQAKAAVYGKFIHPDGAYSEARKDLMNKLANAVEVKGNGRDTLLYHYNPKATVEEVDEKFYALQQDYRAVQAELNGYLHKIETAVQEDAEAKTREFHDAFAEYQVTYARCTREMNANKEARLEAARKLRIVIPNDLLQVYKTVSNLGK